MKTAIRVTSISGERFFAARMATCAFGTCVGTAVRGAGAAAFSAMTGAAGAPRLTQVPANVNDAEVRPTRGDPAGQGLRRDDR